MKLKKNHKKDLNRTRGLYFFVALTLVMLLTYVALEWKTYEKPDTYAIDINSPDDQIDEEASIFNLQAPPPPEPPVAPPVIEIIEDEAKKDETFIGSTESNQEKEVLQVKDVVFDEIDEEIPTTWVTIEQVPIFPGCENDDDKRACFQKMISNHIAKNFRYPKLQQEMGIQGKVYVQFVIEKDGRIENIQLRGPDKNLEAEASRIISKLPKMKPGKQRGTPVKVPFSIPINFKLQ